MRRHGAKARLRTCVVEQAIAKAQWLFLRKYEDRVVQFNLLTNALTSGVDMPTLTPESLQKAFHNSWSHRVGSAPWWPTP